VVFDLDGTLIDSRRDLTTAVNRMRGELGLAPLTVEQVVTMVGEGARRLVERALGPGFSAAEVDRALAGYLRHYRAVCLDTTRAYPGVPELLAALAERTPLALLSNKGEALSRTILEGLGLAQRKPDPAGLLLIAERLGVAADRLLLVGDTWVDAETAKAAGCPFVLVEWGFPRPPGVEAITASVRAATVAELALWLLSFSR
jgi:phosphoglycolate phosphatase